MKYTETIQKQDGSMVTSQMTILFREARLACAAKDAFT